MGTAICFKCGVEKTGPFDICESCRAVPRTSEQQCVSFVFSSLYSSAEQLSRYAESLRIDSRFSPELEDIEEARVALKDPQLLAMLIGRSPIAPMKDKSVSTPRPSVPPGRLPMAPRAPKSSRIETTLHRSPFFLLGVTSRDNRKRIVEMAQEKSLEMDHDLCQKARTDLTNPRNRLGVEIAWLPGVAPRRAIDLVERVGGNPSAVISETGLPVLAHLNLLSAALEATDADYSVEELVDLIEHVAVVAEDLDPEDVLRDINEDRSVAGFPEIQSISQIEGELDERRRYFRTVIKTSLNKQAAESIVSIMTLVVESATLQGEVHAPRLIDDLVDSYEIDSQAFLEKEADNVRKLIGAIRKVIGSGENAALPFVDRLEAVARNWDRVAQPVQLNAKARGVNHDPSRSLAFEIRSLAIDLFNDHNMLSHSQRITALLQEIFEEVPDVAERLEQDSEALAEVFEDRERASVSKVEWGKEITFSAEIGLLFKDTLKISPDGISWKNKNFPLDSITRVRWGGVRHSVNGVPTGSTYTIAFGDDQSEAVVDLKREAVYSSFIEKLWQAVGVRLLVEMLQALKSGRAFPLGGGVLHDDGVTVVKHRLLGSNTQIKCSWDQLHVWSADGNFYIGSQDDKKAYIGLSYVEAANAHVVEQAIRMAFKRPGLRRLSDLLQ